MAAGGRAQRPGICSPSFKGIPCGNGGEDYSQDGSPGARSLRQCLPGDVVPECYKKDLVVEICITADTPNCEPTETESRFPSLLATPF